MGLFSKKEEVPEIAPASTLPELPKTGLTELPSFPNNSTNDNFNQEMVKSAVTDDLSSGENEMKVEIPENLQVTEELPGESSIPLEPSVASSIPEIPQTVTPAIPQIPLTPQKETLELNATKENKPITKSIEPIYIRIDKFQSAQKNFEQIKEKVRDIESLLQKVKDIKSQEETELNGWTEDIEKVKARLAEVDSAVFDQI